MSEAKIAELFLEFSRHKLLDEYWPRLRTCVESLTDGQVWWRPNNASNSVGNLLLHLNGNVRQWIVTSFRETADRRDRPAEFNASGGHTVQELLADLEKTLAEAGEVLNGLSPEELRDPIDIQGYRTTGLAAVYHVVEHFGMHYGQIAYITKLLRDTNLGFYSVLDKTGRPSD